MFILFAQIIDLLSFDKSINKFFKLLYNYAQENEEYLEDCIYSLDAQCKNRIINLMAEMENIYKSKKNVITAVKKGSKSNESVMMRRAILTPSKIEFFRPMSFLRSRFSNMADLDYSLRITLAEDNNRILTGINNCNFIKEKFLPRLVDGIIIGGRLYEFLGSSSSQMRDNGIVFYSKDPTGQTAQCIRNTVGNLYKYKRNVAKYIARFGLIFSQVCLF